jgi:transmembrane sensor
VKEKTNRVEAIEEAASRWLAAQSLGVLDDHERNAFLVWLNQDPNHGAVYRSMAKTWQDSSVNCALQELNEVCRPAAWRSKWTFSFPDGGLFRSWKQFAGFAAAAAILILSVTVGALYSMRSAKMNVPVAHSTAPAEIREMTLTDGSVVTLGARSWITVKMDDNTRRVSLLAGEAYFSVARDPDRLFIVDAGDARVEVVGTRFDVSLAPEGVQVSVAEGIVELIQTAPAETTDGGSDQMAETRKILKQGEKAVASPKLSAEKITPVDVDVPGAWRNGRLIYQNARLDKVIADARRYYSGRIVLASPELGELRVTATFGSDNIIAMIHLLSEQMPVDVEWHRNGDAVLLAAQMR